MRPKEAKNKSNRNDPILKSFYKCCMWGFQECKNNWNVAIAKGCIDFKIQHFYYCGLNALLSNFTFWPLLRPNWGWMKLLWRWYQPIKFRQGLDMNFDDLEAITELVASFFLALYIWMSHPVLSNHDSWKFCLQILKV